MIERPTLEPLPSPGTGEGAPKGRMRASKGATPAFLTGRARELRQDHTDAEHVLWGELRNKRLGGHRFVRQFVVKPYIVDFACRSQQLIIELDGSQHAGSTYDAGRTDKLNKAGWSVLRFWNEEALTHRGEVLDTILAAIEGRLEMADDPHSLRYSPSPASLRSAPSPASGRGEAPLSAPSEARP